MPAPAEAGAEGEGKDAGRGEQLDLQAELDALEGLDEWMRELPCPPWAGEQQPGG